MNTPGQDAIWKEWCDRPAHLMHLSLEEYKVLRSDQSGKVGDCAFGPTVRVKVDSQRARHEPGKMNGSEKRYAAHLDVRKTVGEIVDWKFEPLKLKLARATFWTPDFMVKMSDGTVQLHETKGHWEDDARVKIKWAAQDFGAWFQIVAARWDKGIKDWKFEEFTA